MEFICYLKFFNAFSLLLFPLIQWKALSKTSVKIKQKTNQKQKKGSGVGRGVPKRGVVLGQWCVYLEINMNSFRKSGPKLKEWCSAPLPRFPLYRDVHCINAQEVFSKCDTVCHIYCTKIHIQWNSTCPFPPNPSLLNVRKPILGHCSLGTTGHCQCHCLFSWLCNQTRLYCYASSKQT